MIDWNEAPEGATHCNLVTEFYKRDGSKWLYFSELFGGWMTSNKYAIGTLRELDLTPRPVSQPSYTRDEALQFLVERLDTWPTDIADAPLCPGWGWECGCGPIKVFSNGVNDDQIFQTSWNRARKQYREKFRPFVSVEDAATAEQPSPSGKGDPILGMVLADLTNRALEGKKKYGEPLKAHNGRNAMWDAYQEALDLCMYLRQAIEEGK